MTTVLVIADRVAGEITKPTLEVLTAATAFGAPVVVVFGDDVDRVAPTLGEYGAAEVLAVAAPAIESALVAPKVDAVAQIVDQVGADLVLAPATLELNEVAGRLAVRAGAGLITNAVGVQPGEQGVQTEQSVFAGDWSVTAGVNAPLAIVTVKPNSIPAQPTAAAGAVRAVEVEVSEGASRARITAAEPKADSGRPELSEARIVVSGGNGTKGDFTAVEALADVLGAAVGASRVAVDSGWYPHAYQVGQTGKTVSPQLYLAAGISGAIQHRAGMQTSKAIVVVNSDAEAPIFALADLGVVGDLHQVLPQITEQVRQRKG